MESRTRFRWKLVCVESTLLVLGWRFGDQLGMIWGEEECVGVAKTTTIVAREDQQLQGYL